jgi:fatty-acyl-CoA synthase
MTELGADIVHVYGLTETYGPYTIGQVQDGWADEDPDHRIRLMARQGMSYIGADPVRVVDETMNDVARDGATMGEVVMRGNNVMAGYHDDPEATEKAFRGGWFHSGDLAVWHPDGYIELRDRAKDIIISGGENISTIEVEQAVVSHPAVLEAAVVAMPHEHWGERPKAFVTLKEGMTATPAEIIEHVRTLLAHFKAPDEVEVVDALPKTSTGKIQKFVLRDSLWADHGKRIN